MATTGRTKVSEGKPRPMRSVRVFLRLEHLMALDQEVIKRKAEGNDKNEEGQRINLNRSYVIRDILDGYFSS